jgi:hypothetical protein
MAVLLEKDVGLHLPGKLQIGNFQFKIFNAFECGFLPGYAEAPAH